MHRSIDLSAKFLRAGPLSLEDIRVVIRYDLDMRTVYMSLHYST